MQTIVRRGRWIVSAGCVVAALASCSGGSKSASSPTTQVPPTTSAPLTKAAYVAQANALCRTMNARIDALGNPGSDPIKEAQVTDDTATIVASTLRQLRSLRPPVADTTALTAIYAKVDKLVADSANLSAALRARDRAAAQRALTDVQDDSDSANTASNAYGLTVCGS